MSGKIGAALISAMKASSANNSSELFDTLVMLEDAPTREYLDALHEAVERSPDAPFDRSQTLMRIRQLAASNRSEFLRFLASGALGRSPTPIGCFWINNVVRVRLSREEIDVVRRRSDVVLLDAPDRPDEKSFELLSPAKPPEAKKYCDKAEEAPWNVKRIGAEALWRRGVEGEHVLVAVVDTPINGQHPDLTSRMWRRDDQRTIHGDECVCSEADLFDDAWHGTLSAGVIAGDGSSGLKTGLAPKSQLVSVRVGPPETTAWCGYQYALMLGAHVIAQSSSWAPSESHGGFVPKYAAWRRACEVILAARVPHACSIKTDAKLARDRRSPRAIPFNIPAPANCPPPWLSPAQAIIGRRSSATACGTIDATGRLVKESSSGPSEWADYPFEDYPHNPPHRNGLIKPDVCSFGPGVCSCSSKFSDGREYALYGSSSAATSHLAACFALLVGACLSTGRPVMPARLQQALEATAAKIPGQKQFKENQYGAGEINVEAAFEYGTERHWW